ncbi:tetratricopeptide repeat protein [Streptomyces sp. DH37]|uniref:tetratricopeptide repeat protein n=1 Tax=Streptomyces sp. DH37 TaxID=3040122 RepID=UPI002441CF0A|nr:tetratricopeptide repeat protein [Streptomyces sp. DH37]MDG9702937.1 tetratricopeptide repeat protein [Streptomyces sp. DH37]
MSRGPVTDLWERVGRLEAQHGALALQTAVARHDLAGALHHAGRLTEAEEQYHLAFEGLARRYGGTHPFSLVCLNNLALVLRDQGRWDEALGLLGTVRNGRTALFGPAHPLTLNAANNALVVLVRRGDLAAAAREYPGLLAACEETFGPDDAGTRAVRRDYAHVLDRIGRQREAARLMDTATGRSVSAVLLGCARLLRYTGLFPVAMTASRYGADLTLGAHRGGRTDLADGNELNDDDLGIGCRVVGPRNRQAPYDPGLDLRETSDRVADAVGALGEHLREAEHALGQGRLRVRVFVHHEHWPRLSDPPSLTVDRRRMSARDRARHDRLLRSTAHTPVSVRGAPGPRRRLTGRRDGFSVVFAQAPHVIVSTVIGLDRRPAPSPFEA